MATATRVYIANANNKSLPDRTVTIPVFMHLKNVFTLFIIISYWFFSFFTVVCIVVNAVWAAELLNFPIIKSIYLSIHHFTFVFVFTDKLSVLPESSLGADKSS